MEEFEVIYRKFFKEVFYFVLSMSKDRAVAEDIVQETFLKALNRLDQLQGVREMSPWLCQIAKHTFLDYLEKQQKTVPILECDYEDGMDIEADFLKKESLRAIRKAVKKLDEPYREVFSLRMFGNLSFKEIGAIFGQSDSWARQTCYRAKLKLKERLS